jgi:hypothetical protein
MSRGRSSQTIQVARHDLLCAALTGAECGCQPETETVKYVRVCAHCGSRLSDRRKAYCSRECKRDSGVRSSNLAERQARDEEYRARASEP